MRNTADIQAAVCAMWQLNCYYLRAYRELRAVHLYDSGVVYEREPRGPEQWQTIPILYATRRGDCEDLAAARAAELTVAGVPARPLVLEVPADKPLWHVIVQYQDGRLDDPSRVLGMGEASEEARAMRAPAVIGAAKARNRARNLGRWSVNALQQVADLPIAQQVPVLRAAARATELGETVAARRNLGFAVDEALRTSRAADMWLDSGGKVWSTSRPH